MARLRVREQSAGHPGTRVRVNWVRAGVVVVVLFLLLGLALLTLLRGLRDGALPNLTLVGSSVDLAGLDREELRTIVEDIADDVATEDLEITSAPLSQTSATLDTGFSIDVDATVDSVLRRGRQPNPLSALGDQLAVSFGSLAVQPAQILDESVFEQWVGRLGRELSLRPTFGTVTVADGQVQIELPPASQTIDADALRSLVSAAIGDPAIVQIEVPTRTGEVVVSDEQRTVLEADAERAISAPVTLLRGPLEWAFDVETIADLLAVAATVSDPDAQGIDLVVDPVLLRQTLPVDPGTLASDPTDATFDTSTGAPELVPGRDGFAFDVDVAAGQLLDVATSVGPRTVPLLGRQIEPELTTEEIGRLGIELEVASFSTDHACCEGRVTNIQRIADLVDQQVVRPGETFSLNEAAGPRTVANGFVAGGAIESGEFVDQIGGGVSQFTTTLFNAVFFGGYELLDFQPHSYYISRYPVGREATLNFDPPIDFTFRNDSPSGILIDTSYSDTSITVTLFSSVHAAVETTSGDRYDSRTFEEERRPSDDLPAGTERVSQSGSDGFSVDFTRELVYVDGRRLTEDYTTTYQPQPRIIEVGRGSATEPAVAPGPDVEEPSTTPDPTDRPEAPPPPPPAPDNRPDPVTPPVGTPEPVPEPPIPAGDPEPVDPRPSQPGGGTPEPVSAPGR